MLAALLGQRPGGQGLPDRADHDDTSHRRRHRPGTGYRLFTIGVWNGVTRLPHADRPSSDRSGTAQYRRHAEPLSSTTDPALTCLQAGRRSACGATAACPGCTWWWQPNPRTARRPCGRSPRRRPDREWNVGTYVYDDQHRPGSDHDHDRPTSTTTTTTTHQLDHDDQHQLDDLDHHHDEDPAASPWSTGAWWLIGCASDPVSSDQSAQERTTNLGRHPGV